MSDLEQKDTEIILGTGKLLAIFFGLVIMCGVFFGLGYSVGHSSSPMSIQSEQAGTVVNSPGTKPVAGVTVTATPPTMTVAQPTDTNPNVAANAPVEQVPPPTNDPTASAQPALSDSTPSATVRPVGAQEVPAKAISSDISATPGAITVQVAAVTKEEDAEALVAALRRKNYPVFVSPTPSADSLYHVQVGPFAELKDAEAMKSKLAGDGYNAIVKK